MTLIFATNNQHKVDEVKHLLNNIYSVKSLAEAGINIDIPEPHQTLEENAREKSSVIFSLTKANCFSEDTGLEVNALNGEPGVKSARYAGTGNSADNIELLLRNLEGHIDRSARFRTVISAIIDGREFQFQGICAGRITDELQGEKGFGYDPVFIPDGSTQTFAEMSLEEKSEYSHRNKAMDKFMVFLKQYDEQS